MGWDVWLLGLGMVLVLEGLLPFLSPSAWRETMLRLCQMDDARLRMVGLGSMVAGLLPVSYTHLTLPTILLV